MDLEKEMLKGYIDIIILSILYSGDRYGYELGEYVKDKTENKFELKEGTLYLAFKRLEEAKLIESYWGDESEGGRRKYYKITINGREHLNIKKNIWQNLKKTVDLFLKGAGINEK